MSRQEGPVQSRYVDYTPRRSGYESNSDESLEYYYSPERPPRRVGRGRSWSRDLGERITSPSGGGREAYLNRALDLDAIDPAPSDRADSEFTVQNEAVVNPRWEEEERIAASIAASEIYANTRIGRTPRSEYSYYSGDPNGVVKVKTKTALGGKLVMETMTAPHPCCPNTKGVCCLMVLLNLGLLLITLGFVIVLQLYEPVFVWYVGMSMLIFGFLVIFGSLIYCVFVCRDVEKLRPPPGELYWTHHWTKSFATPEAHYSNTQYKPGDYRASEFSFKTAPSHTTAGTMTTNQY